MHIYLVRHGESQLNASEGGFEKIPDHALNLTKKGEQQALDAGRALLNILKDRGIKKRECRMWVSPYKRARQTAELMNKSLNFSDNQIREDDMLVEINFGLFDGISKADQKELFPLEYEKYQKDRLEEGKFYARRPGGESALDVEIRLRLFFDTIFRDYNAGGLENLIIVCHGALINIFLKAFLHKSHEWYYAQENPSNCSIIELVTSKYGNSTFKYVYGETENKDKTNKEEVAINVKNNETCRETILECEDEPEDLSYRQIKERLKLMSLLCPTYMVLMNTYKNYSPSPINGKTILTFDDDQLNDSEKYLCYTGRNDYSQKLNIITVNEELRELNRLSKNDLDKMAIMINDKGETFSISGIYIDKECETITFMNGYYHGEAINWKGIMPNIELY